MYVYMYVCTVYLYMYVHSIYVQCTHVQCMYVYVYPLLVSLYVCTYNYMYMCKHTSTRTFIILVRVYTYIHDETQGAHDENQESKISTH